MRVHGANRDSHCRGWAHVTPWIRDARGCGCGSDGTSSVLYPKGYTAAPAPPAPLSAAFGRTALLPNPASLAGDDASAARYTPNGRELRDGPLK
jgi:hypothetical protein